MSLFSFKSKSVSQNVSSNHTLINKALLFQILISYFQDQNNNLFSQLIQFSDSAAAQFFSQNQESSFIYISQKFLLLNNRLINMIFDSHYAFLTQFDTIFVINNSDNMTERS